MEVEQRALHEILDKSGRFGLPEEVADTVVLTCSPRAAYITTADIRVDQRQRRERQPGPGTGATRALGGVPDGA